MLLKQKDVLSDTRVGSEAMDAVSKGKDYMEVLQLEYMKGQCKMNNDYKSHAALARLQKNTVYNAQLRFNSQKEFFSRSRTGNTTTNPQMGGKND